MKLTGYRNAAILFFFLICSGYSQNGNYYLTNFSPAEYSESDQNWCSLQDKWGRMYVANSNCVLLNDGKNWKSIKLRHESRCYSLDKDKNDKIFVGGETEFGYLHNKPNGKIEYESLSKQLKEKDLDFLNVWAVRCINDEVYFCAKEKIFLYKNGKLKTFSPEVEGFHTFFKVGQHLFVRERQVGFKVFIDGDLKKIPGSEIFENQRVDFILPFKDNIYWVGCRDIGMHLLVYNKEDPTRSTFSKIASPADVWMKENELYCGAKLNESGYAMGSLKGGLLIADNNFKPVNTVNTDNGLLDNGVKNIFSDINGNLWLSLNLGVSMAEFNTPITRWTKNNGVKGGVESSIKFEGKIYIATGKGLQVLDEKSNKFIDTEISEDTYALLLHDKELFVATSLGLYKIANSKIELLFEYTIYSIYMDEKDKSILYLGTDLGLIIGKYRNGRFTEIKNYDDWGQVRSAAGNKKGAIAFGTSANGVYVLNTDTSYNYQHLDTTKGLFKLIETNVFNYRDELFIVTDSGFYKIENTQSLTAKKSKILNPFANNVVMSRGAQINNDIWFQGSREENGRIKKNELSTLISKGTSFTEDHKMLSRIKGVDTKDIFADSNMVYLSTNDGLYCYNLKASPNKNNFYTFISTVSFGKDTAHNEENITPEIVIPDMHIPYSSNVVSIVPAASDFYDKNEIEFCWYLKGHEEAYCSWTKTEKISYNNLFEGTYTIFVKSRNILGQEGKEVSLTFTILPPLYRTWWAYTIYAIAIIGLLVLIFRWRTSALRERQKQLEQTVEERTAEVVLQKDEAEHQKELVQEKQKEILDSINYAKRIQYSLLAGEDLLNENLKNYFLFFKPKDVVSGDFYWAEKLSNGNFAMVAADSTGHGVPGAIMSILNISCLSEAVIADKQLQPAEILNAARKKIISHLLNDGSAEGGKDGMDASLICFDFANKKLTYAAANNPVWIVRGTEFIPLKADRMPVGKHDRDNIPFVQQEFNLQEGDMVYSITDGFPDQFGGPKGKKFKYKQLEELLVSIAAEPMEIQKQKLDSVFENWKGDLEQVDDVTIIGIRI